MVQKFQKRVALVLVLVLVGALTSPDGADAAKPDRIAPSVSITSPASGTTYTASQTLTIAASASDNVGVSKVEFYDNGVLKGTDTASPYGYVWSITSASNGSHRWTAKAYDAAGNSTVSSAVTLNVNIDGTAPAVSITSPASGTSYTSAQTVTVTASASDNLGVSRVEFYDNGVLKGTDTASPYNFAWSFTASNNGAHSWTAKAYDTAGNVTTSIAVSLTVSVLDTTAPTVSITSPASGTTYTSAQTVTIAASASDNVGVSKVEFYDNGVLKGTDTTSSYSFAWSFTASNNGTHSWTAKAYDAAGHVTTSTAVSLTVNISADTPPSVSITSPASGTAYTAAQTVTITASASDNIGVSKVEFYDNGVLKGTDTASPYNIGWSFTASNNGAHSWTAKAYDTAGQVTASTAVSLTVSISSDTPPTVSITSPASGTAYTAAQTVTITASASDNIGVSKVEFYDNGVLKGTDTASPYNIGWSFTASNNGAHSWTAKAYDTAGQVTASTAVSLTVNISADTPPSVSITSPTSGTTYTSAQTVTITASASDNIGVSKVEFYDNGVLKGTDTASPFNVGWSFTSSNNGTHSWTAKAYDTAGNMTTSTAASLTVNITDVSTSGALLWGLRLGGTSVDIGYAAATDSQGNIVVAGLFSGTVDFGNGSVTSRGVEDIVVAKYAGDGRPLWSRAIGGTSTDKALSVAVDGSDDVIVGGLFNSPTIDFGKGPITNAGLSDIFIAKFSGLDGTTLWAKGFGGSDNQWVNSVAVDGNGDVGATGSFVGSLAFGGTLLASASNGQDTFFVKLAGGTGGPLWAKNFPNQGLDEGTGIAVDGNGNWLLTGRFDGGKIDLGGGYLVAYNWSRDAFLGKFSSTGGYLWSRQLGGPSIDAGYAVATTPTGDVVVTGTFSGTADFAGGTLTASDYVYQDVFVAAYSGVTGNYMWARRSGGANTDEYPTSISVAPDADVIVAGHFSGTGDFGGVTLASAGGEDWFVVKYSSAGVPVWSNRFGGSSTDLANAVTTDAAGNVILAGYFMGTINLGGNTITSNGSTDTLVLKLTP